MSVNRSACVATLVFPHDGACGPQTADRPFVRNRFIEYKVNAQREQLADAFLALHPHYGKNGIIQAGIPALAKQASDIGARFAIKDHDVKTLLRQAYPRADDIGTRLDPNIKFFEDKAQDLSC